MNGLQSLDQWQESFNYPTGGMLGLLNAIQNIGALAAYPMAPYLTDGFGRRPAVLFGATIMLGATAIQTASNSVNMFIGARFLIGFGLTFATNAAPLLVSEISYPPYRAPLTSLYNSLWYSGAIVAAWSTYGTFQIPNSWSWRVPSLLQGLPSLFQVRVRSDRLNLAHLAKSTILLILFRLFSYGSLQSHRDSLLKKAVRTRLSDCLRDTTLTVTSTLFYTAFLLLS